MPRRERSSAHISRPHKNSTPIKTQPQVKRKYFWTCSKPTKSSPIPNVAPNTMPHCHLRKTPSFHTSTASFTVVRIWSGWTSRKCSTSSWKLKRLRRLARHPLLRSEEHTSELQSRLHLVCRLL